MLARVYRACLYIRQSERKQGKRESLSLTTREKKERGSFRERRAREGEGGKGRGGKEREDLEMWRSPAVRRHLQWANTHPHVRVPIYPCDPCLLPVFVCVPA
ncbi:hypothetical protein FRC16_000157 [Serendipita sp. 398]|nr:hypothetical protein FRC16_000157 [Serendipita sp. 398]